MRALNGNDPIDEQNVKNNQNGNDIFSILKHHSLDNPAIDLANRALSTIPPSLFTLPHIQVCFVS